MNFEKKLQMKQFDKLWQEYCGFLDLDLTGYMQIQNRLMTEQIALWSRCGLGQKLLRGAKPKSIDDFRATLPLTTYSDYADILLQKQASMLPGDPVIWIQTTWEGGKHPFKVAPYTKSMLDVYKNNVVSCFMLSTSKEKGKFDIKPNDKMLYGLAPLPYATGLLPLLLNDEITLEFLPPVAEAEKMTFGERNRKGFELGLKKGIDLFFGVSSVANYISGSLAKTGSGGNGSLKKLFELSPKMAWRFIVAKYKCSKEGRTLRPSDLFKLKGFVCAGTDSCCYKDSLEEYWGCRPMEIAAGTESTCIGTEGWTHDGLYFFPDACFYEFIPEDEMLKNMADPSYEPKTFLMNEVVTNQNYELVITVLKGGAFARYRIGDMYRCLGFEGDKDSPRIPRFAFVDRVPSIIDIAGFTRITENSISDVIKLSGLGIQNWIACKELNGDQRPYMHLYVEMTPEAIEFSAVSKKVLAEHLSIYFTYFDSDYNDLKRLLGMDPLEITILKTGTFKAYQRETGRILRHMNPSKHDLVDLLRFQSNDYGLEYDLESAVKTN